MALYEVVEGLAKADGTVVASRCLTRSRDGFVGFCGRWLIVPAPQQTAEPAWGRRLSQIMST
jgi:hypothetical protein